MATRGYKVRHKWVTKCNRLWITKCDKMDYKVRQGLQSVSRWITKCDGITKCLYSDLVFCQLEEAVTFQFTKCAHLPTPPPLHKK